ncbi:hypothetical protein TVAG_230380 [Trichomonas vaginalis G3]|uniref:Baseplate structural protein Gp10 C-terminal domain-containing protein n=1 Tax=Trichomonas vaginalis (strain ATCC PRA-98 / G3) TaxID=412133 RepID=A2GMM3_TRIV3|nr:hypothetical protein TVAG_230380 [Trichomonas vaginalis G3]|eukprot:XP_001294524.1 hypothetical protein [Trichomonas vaginalis G3]
MNKVLKSHKHNISDINELQATLDSKADKNHTHKSFTTVRADDIILNYDLGSSAPLENPSTSVKDTLNSLNSKCMNIEGHVRNFETHELPAMLDKKADKEHTHKSFTTVRADDIILNYDLGSSAPLENPSTSVKDTLNSLNSKCMNIEGHVRNFETHELPAMLDKKADKEHTHKSFTTVRADDIILNYDLGSSAPLENPSTSVKDTLNNLDNSCRNIEGHARNFEAYELPAMLDKKADKTELQTLKTEILQTLYPVGSIYTSMNSTNPETVLGFGTWKQIVDKFLYCARYSKQTGGSKKIKEANLPPHTHTGTTNTTGSHSHSITKRGYTNLAAGSDRQGMHRYDISSDPVDSSAGIFCGTAGNHSHTFTTNPTGSGADYMPPFVTRFAWYRVQ